MRIHASGPTRKPARSKPSARQRWLLFILGALLGGVLGFGYRTSGPGPSPQFSRRTPRPGFFFQPWSSERSPLSSQMRYS